jgi:hypothetical protein
MEEMGQRTAADRLRQVTLLGPLARRRKSLLEPPRALINSSVASTLLLGKDTSYTDQPLGRKKRPF